MVLIGVGLTWLFLGTSASADTAPRTTGNFDPETVENAHTLQIERAIRLPLATDQVRFLLNHLDLACGIIRSWELEAFRARRIKPNLFLADDGAGMKGRIAVLQNDNHHALLIGWGRYQSPTLGYTLHGRAVARFRMQSIDSHRSEIQATLSVKVNNFVLHAIGKVFTPVVRVLARRKSDHLVSVARRTARRILDHPVRTGRLLREAHPRMVRHWDDFPRRTPDYLATQGRTSPKH